MHLLILIISQFCCFFEFTHAVPAMPEVAPFLHSTEIVSVSSATSAYHGILYTPIITRETDVSTATSFSMGFILYPGGFIDHEAYAPICFQLATLGYPCYIAKFPGNIAVLDPNQGLGIMRHLGDSVSKWTGIGHSMGGAYIAQFCLYIEGRTEWKDKMAGYVMLDARPAKNMISYAKPTVLIYHGTRNMPDIANKIEAAQIKSPQDMKVYELPGGNHAGYAYYEEQPGDDEATISKDKQIQLTIGMILTNFSG